MEQDPLFTVNQSQGQQLNQEQPLAARMRPQTLQDYVGQSLITQEGGLLQRILSSGYLPSLILWGPPGSGKTSLALLLAAQADYHCELLSAVMAGVKDIRHVIEQAKLRLQQQSNKKTLVFIDEVHRFNKAQQDALLPHVENGLLTLIGATTENPSFELNNALLSRAQVLVLEKLDQTAITQLLQRAVNDDALFQFIDVEQALLKKIADNASGDARRALNLLECLAQQVAPSNTHPVKLKEVDFKALMTAQPAVFDKQGDHFYDQISALHKSVRGSSPDAALYWLARMLEGGCDPLYIARRVIRMATEDIGLADPRAVQVCLNAWDLFQRLGSPEGELGLAQAVLYLAVAPKSNAVYTAYKQARVAAKDGSDEPVPMHLRNAPTALAKSLAHGADYRYAHDFEGGFVAGESYLPQNLKDLQLYQPTEQGMELKIRQRLAHWQALNYNADFQRYPD